MAANHETLDDGHRRVTLADVALAAGVSPAAVSLALRGERGISRETRERITRWARQCAARAMPPRRGSCARNEVVGHSAQQEDNAWNSMSVCSCCAS